MNYKVLLCDDETRNFQFFCDQADKEGVELNCFEFWDAAQAELQSKWDQYAAIILDYKGKISANTADTNPQHLGTAYNWLSEQKGKGKYIPIVIYTAHEEDCKQHYSEDNFIIYGKQVKFITLLNDIKILIEKSPIDKIKYKYARVFEVCSEKYIGEQNTSTLLEILYAIENDAANFKADLYFNKLRIIIEDLFRAANRIGILHDKCIVNGQVRLNWACNFLSGDEVYIKERNEKIRSIVSPFNPLIAKNVKYIIDITNAGSHSDKSDEDQPVIKLSEYLDLISSPFLLFSITFELLDVLLWFKIYTDGNSDISSNKNHWKSEKVEPTVFHKGFIQQDKKGNFFCDQYLLSYKRIIENFSVNDKIIICNAEINTNSSTKSLYPMFARNFELENK